MDFISAASTSGGTPDDNSVTSAKIVDGAIVNADINASADIAYTKVRQPLPPDVMASNSQISTLLAGAGVMNVIWKPNFWPILPPYSPSFPLSALMARVNAVQAGSTWGAAVYTIAYTGTRTFNASLVAQLNAVGSGASTGNISADVTTGAAASGASVYTMDFTANRYILGIMASEVTNLQFTGSAVNTINDGIGVWQWNTTARSGGTDWPSSFTESSVAVANGARVPLVYLVNATGKQYA